MLTRATDATLANKIINDPQVRPHMLFDIKEAIDLSGLVNTTLILMSENGGFLFAPIVDQRIGGPPQPAHAFELHSFFLPEGRGREAHGAAWEAAEYIFTKTDATDIFTMQPLDNPASRPPRSMGFQEHFRRNNIITRGGRKVPCAFWRLNIWDWARLVRGVEADGDEFHSLLNQKRAALGLPDHAHEQDDAHDRYVGCAVRMWKQGQTLKAIRFLNYFSRWAGYARLEILAINEAGQIVVDMGDGLIIGRLDRFEFEVVPPDDMLPKAGDSLN